VLDMKPHTEVARAARNLAAARSRLEVAMADAEHAAIAAYDAGDPETVIAANLGVNRLTVRKWLGKDK
jgi:hypothetical protein